MKPKGESSRQVPTVLVLAVLVLGTSLLERSGTGWTLPEERGTAGILSALRKLPVYARVVQVMAHPDDESAGTLVWLARRMHARTAVFSLTRGEGGQNILGDEKYEALGLLRTGEMLEACRIYGAELYFASMIDFGFSKSAEETFANWDHEAVLEELVRFIRTWRPAVILSKFRGNPWDGHGHHQAAGIVTHEAFAVAADPGKFPQHLRNGLRPWQPKKLYDGGGFGPPGSSTGENWTVRVPVGDYDPVLGRSCREIGAEGYSRHRTQGNGAVFALPGQAFDSFVLTESTVGKKERETSFFDGIGTSLSSILELAGNEQEQVAFLRPSLEAAQEAGTAALAKFDPLQPSKSAPDTAKGAAIMADALRRLDTAPVSAGTREILRDALQEKLNDYQAALNRVLGIQFIARTDSATGVPGQKLSVAATLFDRGEDKVELAQAQLRLPGGRWISPAADTPVEMLESGASGVFRFDAELPPEAPATEPFFHRENRKAARYRITATDSPFAPFGPPVLLARATYRYGGAEGSAEVPVQAQLADPLRGTSFPDFQIVPALSVSIAPEFALVPLSSVGREQEFQVTALSHSASVTQGDMRLVVPSGWQVEPPSLSFALARKGQSYVGRFRVRAAPRISAGALSLDAVVASAGVEYRRGYRVVTDRANWIRHLYSPATARVLALDVRVAPNLTVGYIPGAGDEVPAALEQLGVKVQVLSEHQLAYGDLNSFSVLVTGVRAYNVNEALRSHAQRLLDYVRAGGTLIVQYNTPLGRPGADAPGSPFPYGPFPMANSASDRITVEDAPVVILDPANPVFTTPNRIVQSDFDGWIQERGLYFMNQWDSRYAALLSSRDPGEEEKRGGMLVTQFGKGYYVYTAYAWFRQLPAGIPGAFRLFANLLSLGK